MLDICEQCLSRLASYGGVAVQVFDAILDRYINQGNIEIKSTEEDLIHFEEVIRFLELKGFVITTEADQEYIKVRPKGIFKAGDYNYVFCLHYENHKTKVE